MSEDGQLCAWSSELLGGGEGGSVGEGEGHGTEPPTEDDRRLAAALVATQFVHQHSLSPRMHELGNIAKVIIFICHAANSMYGS